MDSYNVNTMKVTRINAIEKHPQLQKIAGFFRLVEVCIFLALMSSFSTHLPEAVKNSSKYFRDVLAVLVSPHFVFVMGNVIIITLLARSGHFSGQNSAKKKSTGGYDLYDEFVKKSQDTRAIIIKKPSKHVLCHRNLITEGSYSSGKTEKSKDIQVSNNKYPSTVCTTERSNGSGEANEIKRSRSIQARKVENRKQNLCQGSLITQGTHGSGETKNYKRSQSENSKHEQKNHQERSQLVLRRSETEKGIKTIDSAKKSTNYPYPEDKMSSDEFRGVVEAFIARQQKLRIEEYYV